MLKKGEIVLIDTNVIIEAHRVNCWNALVNYFDLHTVEKVVEETQTGFQNRRPEQIIDQNQLKNGLRHIQVIDPLQVIEFDMNNPKNTLDDGEKQLIIYAQTIQENVWLLNSPDLALVKYACNKNWGDRLISLEAMAKHLNFTFKSKLASNFTENWLSQSKLKINTGVL